MIMTYSSIFVVVKRLLRIVETSLKLENMYMTFCYCKDFLDLLKNNGNKCAHFMQVITLSHDNHNL